MKNKIILKYYQEISMLKEPIYVYEIDGKRTIKRTRILLQKVEDDYKISCTFNSSLILLYCTQKK